MLSERNLVVILFVMVFVIFSLAQEDTKKIERMYQDSNSSAADSRDNEIKVKSKASKDIIPVAEFR